MQPVRSKNDHILRVWEKITIVVGEGIDAGIYEARVEDFLNGGIVVTQPEFISGRTLLRQDISVIVQITREDAAYQFHSRVKVQGSSASKRIILAPPNKMHRRQRRRFVRVEFPVVVTYAEFSPGTNWSNWKKELVWHDSYASDISAGGIQMKLNDKISQEGLLLLEIDILKKERLPEIIVGECRRTFEREGESFAGVLFLLADDLRKHFRESELAQFPTAFKQFDDKCQNRLVTYLFHKEIELRQKGLI